jgi:hypothetical protein
MVPSSPVTMFFAIGSPRTGYRATVRIGTGAGPGTIGVQAFSPVSCAVQTAPAVYVGGRYEWDLTATNGWRLTLKTLDAPWSNQTSSGAPHTLEFSRLGEAVPFQVLDARMRVDPDGGYSGDLRFNGGDLGRTGAEIDAMEQQLRDPSFDAQGRAELQRQLAEVRKRLESETAYPTLEVACSTLRMRPGPDGRFSADVACDDPAVGTLKASGTIKFIGP